MIKRLCVIGVGLIGGSLALALRRAGVVEEIVGVGRSLDNLELARERGIIDSLSRDARAAVAGADMVVLATALGATAAVLDRIGASLEAGATVTDVGSTKASVVAAARRALGDRFAAFVPGHPIAGTERSGAGAAFAELYIRHKVILTPLSETDPRAVERVGEMWRAVGAEVVEMSVDGHDRALAATSHLPHLLAYNLVDTLAGREDAERIFNFAAGGFRDFTRIASSNPRMWVEISLANQAALLDAARDHHARFATLLEALEAGDGATLLAAFERAKRARDEAVVPEANGPE